MCSRFNKFVFHLVHLSSLTLTYASSNAFLPTLLSLPLPPTFSLFSFSPLFFILTPFFSSFSPSLSLSLFLLPFPFTRPLFIVGEDQKLTIKKSHIYKIRNSRGNVSGEYGWHDVLYEVRTCVSSFDHVACGCMHFFCMRTISFVCVRICSSYVCACVYLSVMHVRMHVCICFLMSVCIYYLRITKFPRSVHIKLLIELYIRFNFPGLGRIHRYGRGGNHHDRDEAE